MFKMAAIGFIKIYRAFVSPALFGLGLRCRFHPTCSEYALDAFRIHRPRTAFKLSAARLLKCGPWNSGGVDAVPFTKGIQ